MFGFLGDNIDSVQQAAEINNTGKKNQDESGADLLPGFGSLWSVAKAVQSAVQQTADEVVRSVQETDWKSELTAFTQEVEAEAHKAVEVVQHLPAQLQTRTSDSGADGAAAHGSTSTSPSSSAAQPFGVVGSSLANFGKQLISGTKEVIDTVTDMVEGEIATATREVPRFSAGARGGSGSSEAAARLASRQRLATRYSRFEAEVAAMQRDSATYVDEPEDGEDFAAWRSTNFSMGSAQPEIDKILSGNAFMSELQSRLVPLLVEKEDFWARYFYRLHKLQQKEEQRQQLAARAKQLDDEDELGGWDDDDSPHAAAAADRKRQQQQPQEEVHKQQQKEPSQQQQQQQEHEPEAAAAAADTGAPGSRGSVHEDKGPTSTATHTADVDATPTAAPATAETAAPAAPAEVTDETPPPQQHSAQKHDTSKEDDSKARPAHTTDAVGGSDSAAASTAAVAAATAAAAAAAAAPVLRKVSEDSSIPSTPVQVGSDVSDAAPATDTVSDASGATTGPGSGAHWTMVAGGPAGGAGDKGVSPKAAAAGTAAGSVEAGTAAATALPQQDDKQATLAAAKAGSGDSSSGSGAQSSPGAAPPAQAAAPPPAASKPAAAASKPATTAAATAAADDDDDEDDDWGDDADDAVAAVSKGGAAGAAGGAAAGGGDGDDDWGNWE